MVLRRVTRSGAARLWRGSNVARKAKRTPLRLDVMVKKNLFCSELCKSSKMLDYSRSNEVHDERYKDLNENPETFRLKTFLPLRFIPTVFFCHSFDSVSMVTQRLFDSLAGPKFGSKFGSPPPGMTEKNAI